MVLPQRIHARHPRVKGVVSAAVGSEFVFGAAQSGQRVDRVEGDDQRIGGPEAQHRFDGGEVGDDERQGRHQNRRKQCAESGDQLLAGFALRCQDGGCISRLICGRSGNRQSRQGNGWCRLWGSGRGVNRWGNRRGWYRWWYRRRRHSRCRYRRRRYGWRCGRYWCRRNWCAVYRRSTCRAKSCRPINSISAAIVCLSPSNRLDCHRFNVTLQHYASASPYA